MANGSSLPSDPTIEADVRKAVRYVVTDKTGITSDEYHVGIVPTEPHPNGWESDTPAWNELLGIIEARLRARYRWLDLAMTDAEETIDKTLSETVDMIIGRIKAQVPAKPPTA